MSAAQLYLNREIWGFNTISLSPELAKSRGRPLGIPTLTVEQTYAVMLRQYLSFMNGKLGAPPPYRIEAGASGITGYFILMPNNFSDDAWGPILQDVSWSGILTSLDATAVDATLLKIFDAFFDAAACKRPEGLYGFPGATPGAVPR